MSFENRLNRFKKHGYHAHSNPGMHDGYTIWDKGVLRRDRYKAAAIIEGDAQGDMEWAKHRLAIEGKYTDSRGDTQYNDNPNMCAGRAVQLFSDEHLAGDVHRPEAYAAAIEYLQWYQSPFWRDKEQEAAVMRHRVEPMYDSQGKKLKLDETAGHCEFELVCNNAEAGLREAMRGDNKITPEITLRGKLPGCQLEYVGKPDYQEGKVELKTQWDSNAHTDSPRANSLPNEIRENHLTQIAGYNLLSGHVPKIVYANRLGYRVFEATQEQLEFGIARIVEACKRRERLLMAHDKIEDVLRLTDPMWSHMFAWRGYSPEIIHQAKQIWGD